ncbi:RNA-binding protein 7 [Cylas formicarius]|uniref:RNA-binding protein 7 n=1 Tax=Cylas formicarius TaxID=197179 RepID=UPI0029587CA5|nr:RNA-binding protein 7 [Cylas formicarius]
MDDSRTVWVGNLADEMTEELLYELFLQAAPLERVKIPSDKQGKQSNYGFVTFKHEVSVPYVIKLLNDTRLFDRNITIKPRQTNNPERIVPSPVGKEHVQHFEDHHHNRRQNQHMRFNLEALDYNALMNMGEQMNVFEHYDNRVGRNYGTRDKNNFGDRGRPHRHFNRSHHEFDRRNNFYQNNRKQRNERRNNSFESNRRGRHY